MCTEQVFAVPGRLGIIDMAIQGEDGVLVAQISKETIEQLGLRYPGVVLTTFDVALAAQNEAMKSEPVEISKEAFFDALECLPPMGWTTRGNSESFKMSEFTCGNITGIYARLGGRYFTLSDVASLKHDEIIGKITKLFY